jgi:hypothetical protein
MTRYELHTRLEAAEKQNLGLLDEIKNLKAQLAEMQDEPEIPDFPVFKCLDVTYALDSCFDIMQEEHGGGTGDSDYMGDDASYYNNFHSKDYADEFRRKCLLIAMMLHCKWYCDKEVVTDFSDGYSAKWCVWYDHFSEEWSADSQQTHESTTVYFTTEEAAQKCAEWLNEHWKEDDNDA